MSDVLQPLILIVDGALLSLTLCFTLIMVWYDVRRMVSQLFALLVLLVVIWNVGTLFEQMASIAQMPSSIAIIARSAAQMGFSSAAVALYILTAAMAGVLRSRYGFGAAFSLVLMLAYQTILLVTQISQVGESATFLPTSALFFLIFHLLSLYLLWYYRRRTANTSLALSIVILTIGQSTSLIILSNDALLLFTLITNIGILGIGSSIFRQAIIAPLKSQSSQIEALHHVSMTISRHISPNTVLQEIARQAVAWLDATASCIFLSDGTHMSIAALHDLPMTLHHRVAAVGGMADTAARQDRALWVEHYQTGWRGADDFPEWSDVFGSAICVPMKANEVVIGTIFVVNNEQGRQYTREDAHKLELLASHAAVAISHGQLFAEQQQLTNQLEAVLTSTENPVIAIRRDFKLMFANRAARRVFPISVNGDENLSTLPLDFLPQGRKQVLRDMRRVGYHSYDFSYGGRFYQCHLAPMGHPRPQGWVAVINDISELKELDRIKTEVVRMTSHDLKNPLQAAIAYIDTLRDDLADNLEPAILTESIDKVEKQLKKMTRIITGVLDIERMRRGVKLNEECDLEYIINIAVHEWQDVAGEKNITLQSDVTQKLPGIPGDTSQLERAISNLIENAIKFTPSGGHIGVTAQSTRSMIQISVSDNGIGIPVPIQSRIFDPFYRGEQKGAEHVSGSGLGLNLVKTVIESHRGRVEVESQDGQGATFHVYLPIPLGVVS